MYKAQDLQDALVQVENYVENITDLVTKIRDKSESYDDDLSREDLETLLDDIYTLSNNCLNEIK